MACAVLGGLCDNTSVQGLQLHAVCQAQHLVWHPHVSAALTQLLLRNSTLQRLLLSGPPGYLDQRIPAYQPPPHILNPHAPPPEWVQVGLAENRGVVLLDAEDCFLGDKGGTALGIALRNNRTLLSLKLVGLRAAVLRCACRRG